MAWFGRPSWSVEAETCPRPPAFGVVLDGRGGRVMTEQEVKHPAGPGVVVGARASAPAGMRASARVRARHGLAHPSPIHSLSCSDSNQSRLVPKYNVPIQNDRPRVHSRGENIRIVVRFNVVTGEHARELEARQAAAAMGVLRWHWRQRHKGSTGDRDHEPDA